MTMSAVAVTLGVLLALLLLSAAWAGKNRTWQIVSGPPKDSANRIRLTEFYAEARQQGWEFSADRQLLVDLALGLREAGLQGRIEMWGRKCLAPGMAPLPHDPLLRIAADFWKHHDIDGLRMALAAGTGEGAARLETNNLRIQTRAFPTSDPDFDDATYRDLHLNYLQAMDWLQVNAASYRGVSQRE